jgi:hypothetical protein
MTSGTNFRTALVRPIQSKRDATPGLSSVRWLRWFAALGTLGVLVVSSQVYGADPPFNFNKFTGNKPFTLNTMWTTPFGPPWADIVLKKENFLACKGAEIALCYYSGPEESQTGGAATPCDLSSPWTANCTCYVIPAGHPYLVDINAILNLDVYLDTVKKCDSDGSKCQPTGPHSAPVCDAINSGSLVPGAEVISTFSLALAANRDIPLGSTACYKPAVPDPLYAGCMTAPCEKLRDRVNGDPVVDPYSGLELAQCACPLWEGNFQVGQGTKQDPESCTLGDHNVWSAAYSPKEELLPLLPPPPPPPHDCWPDAPGDTGCPLLPPNYLPQVPRNVSCQQVCSEYKQSNRMGVQVGFTCDATLCTAASDPALVKSACTGLAKHSVSEILKLEIEVGFSCAASQVCGCEPNKKTNDEIWRLNEAQRALGIDSQCKQNGTLCGTIP